MTHNEHDAAIGLPPIKQWLVGNIDTAISRCLEKMRGLHGVSYLAVMPDVHVAGNLCVGTALATNGVIYPAAVGGDIGCGMLAMAFDIEADALTDGERVGKLLRRLSEVIPATRRHRKHKLELPHELKAANLSDPKLTAVLHGEGQLQLGTLGGGNHFIELQSDEDGRLWLLVHSGSRALGQAVMLHHVHHAKQRSEQGGLVWLCAQEKEGKAYLNDSPIAAAYARENRRAMANMVEQALNTVLGTAVNGFGLIECDHNHVRYEEHFGEWWYVHRKGAMSVEAGMAGVIPGSMATMSFHVEGKGEPSALKSASHGAGRKLTRGEARKSISPETLARQMKSIWYNPREMDGLREEGPGAYKDVKAVIAAQEGLVKVTRKLRPVMIYKGM